MGIFALQFAFYYVVGPMLPDAEPSARTNTESVVVGSLTKSPSASVREVIEVAATFDSQIGDIGRPITTVRVAFAVPVGIVCECLSAEVRVREGDVVVGDVLAFQSLSPMGHLARRG